LKRIAFILFYFLLSQFFLFCFVFLSQQAKKVEEAQRIHATRVALRQANQAAMKSGLEYQFSHLLASLRPVH
jgi:hypothetical protein